MQTPLGQAQPFDLVIDGADVVLLQRLDLIVQGHRALQTGKKGLPGAFALGNDFSGFLDGLEPAVEIAPFMALQNYQVFGRGPRLNVGINDPAEIRSVRIAVADLEQITGNQRPIFGNGLSGRPQTRRRHFFGIVEFADQGDLPAVFIHIAQFLHRRRPEMPQAANGDQQQQTQHGDQTQPQSAGIQPDPRNPGFQPLPHHRLPYCLRRR